MGRARYVRTIVTASAALLGVLLGAAAAVAQPQLEPQTSFSGSMGTVTVDGQQFYRMSLRPDIPLGNWGLALDVELFIDQDGGISSHGWEFGTSTEALDSFLRKIYYVRYGHQGDPTYAKLGALDDVTLGYGLIMSDYRNTVQYPGIKKTGVEFELRNLGGTGFGVEGMVNNVQDFQGGGALLGLRVFGHAVGRLEVGVTYVVDLDQYGGLIDSDGDGYPDAVDAFPNDDQLALDNDRDGVPDDLDTDDDNDGGIDVDAGSGLSSDVVDQLTSLGTVLRLDNQVNRRRPFNSDQVDGDRFGILGLDVAYPLAERQQLQLKVYGQLAFLMDDSDSLSVEQATAQGVMAGNRKAKGWGIAAPGVWMRTGPLTGQIELRHFRDDFDAQYFDNLYELDRARIDPGTGRVQSKDARLGRSKAVSGVFGKLGADLGQYVHAAASYQYLTGADDPKQQLVSGISLSQQILQRIPRLTRARGYYQKNNIGAGRNEDDSGGDGFFESTEDTFYGYELGLEMTGGVSVVWDTRYVFERTADRHLERQKIMTIETVFDF